MKPILYYAPNTCALAPQIALFEAGVEFDTVLVDFSNREQYSAEYLKVNSKGRVPALLTDEGTLTETPAILSYIAQSHPDAELAPLDDAFKLAQVHSFNSYLCSTVHVAHAHGRRGYRWANDEAAIIAMKQRVPRSMIECFELLERDLFIGPWAMGDRFTICDAYLFTVTRWLALDNIDKAMFLKINAHHARMLHRDSVRKALVLNGTPD